MLKRFVEMPVFDGVVVAIEREFFDELDEFFREFERLFKVLFLEIGLDFVETFPVAFGLGSPNFSKSARNSSGIRLRSSFRLPSTIS